MPAAAWALAGAAALLFGLGLVLTRFGLRHMAAGTGAAFAIPVSAILFWAISPATVDFARWSAPAAMVFAGVGAVFPAVVTLLTFAANRRLGPNVTGTVGNLAPVFAVTGAVLLLGETPGLRQGAALLAIVGGVMLLSWPDRKAASPPPGWWLLVPLAAASMRGGIQPAVRYGLELWPDPFAAALIGYTVSSAVVIVAALAGGGGTAKAVNRNGVVWFAAVGLVNGLAVLSMYAALARGPVALVSPVVALYPLATLAFAAWLLHAERPSGRQIAGILAAVAGVILLLT